MKTGWMAACAVLVMAGTAWSAEVTVKAPIESVGLFKNGLAVVQRTVKLPGPGVYRVEDLPTPVHGTFWIESAVPVTATAGTRVVEGPVDGAADLQSDLAGRFVEVHLRESDRTVRGTVAPAPEPKDAAKWDRSYEQPVGYPYFYYRGGAVVPSGLKYLVLENGNTREYVEVGQISRVTVMDGGKTVKRRQPVLLLEVGAAGPESEKESGEMVVSISYLGKGISWAPSYRVNLLDGKRLRIDQQAVVRNELMDLSGAEVYLISGYPSIEFGHVVSPLSPETTWSTFFQQLGQRFRRGSAAMSNMVQQAVATNTLEPGAMNMPVPPEGEGVDLHYQAIGRRTLQEGDAMSVSVASAEAEYQRVVEWVVPDTRDANGRHVQEYQWQQEPEKYDDDPWDALRFKNPFAFAMTTAPAMILQQGRFSGQRQSYWVNPGEQTTLRITKALSLRTRAAEQELPDQREVVWIGRNDYRKVGVKGELLIRNQRNEDVEMVVRRQFSGELVRADGEPKSELREEGAYSVNRRNQLTWTMPLKAGESVTLGYEYTVLIDQ